LKVDDRVGVQMESAAIRKEHLDAPTLGADAIAGQERHRRGIGVAPAVTFQHRSAIDERDVSR
jgi:hypothetical protein